MLRNWFDELLWSALIESLAHVHVCSKLYWPLSHTKFMRMSSVPKGTYKTPKLDISVLFVSILCKATAQIQTEDTEFGLTKTIHVRRELLKSR